jgi:hypothetical protein
LKELQSIRNLLILQLLKNGATSEEINLATGMGAGNIRALFPKVKKKGAKTKRLEEEDPTKLKRSVE